MSEQVVNGVLTGKSVAELNALIAEATARKAEMFDAELMEMVRDVEARCEALNISPMQVVTLLRKGRRGRPRRGGKGD